MKEIPILFQSAMVRAILAGTKTQTRRIAANSAETAVRELKCLASQARWHIGDRLWVRESWRTDVAFDRTKPCEIPSTARVIYEADHSSDHGLGGKGRPSIFMPRWACRIRLDVTEVRTERLQDISESDAIAEGIRRYSGPLRWIRYLDAITGEAIHSTARDAYRALWNAINLPPSPIEERDEHGKRHIVGYVSYPWSGEDFDAAYPGVRAAGMYRGKPIAVHPDPYVWAICFRRVV